MLLVLNRDPFNHIGRRFDELLQIHLKGAFIMTCPPVRKSEIGSESNYYADVVLAAPTVFRNNSELVYFRSRLEFLAGKLADAIGLSDRGHKMLRPRVI